MAMDSSDCIDESLGELFLKSLEYLHSPNLAHQEYSLRILINSTLDEQRRNVVLLKTGTQTFVELFQSPSEAVQMLAAWLLSHMTLDDNICSMVLQSDMAEHFVPLLHSDNSDVQEKVLWVFNNLLLNDSEGRFSEQFSLIEKFTKLLLSPFTKTVKTTAQILGLRMRQDSCPNYKKNQDTFLGCQGIAAIASILSPSFPPRSVEIQEAAIDLLCCLTLYTAIQREAVANSSAISCVLTFIADSSTNVDLLLKSLQIIYNISLDEHTFPYLIDREAIPVLVSRLNFPLSSPSCSFSSSTTARSLELCLFILANLMVDDAARISFRTQALGVALLRVLSELSELGPELGNSDELERTIAEIFGNAACDEYLRAEFQSIGVAGKLSVLTNSKNPEIAEIASTAVENVNLPVPKSVLSKSTEALNAPLGVHSTMDKVQRDTHIISPEEALSSATSPITREILQSELTFVKKLDTFIKVYLDPLNKPDGPLSKDLISFLFLNIREIWSIHAAFAQEMARKIVSGDDGLGDLFAEFGKKAVVIDSYRIFFAGFEKSLTILGEQIATSSKFKDFLEIADKNPDCTGLNFAAFLIMPTQRIERYLLFLQELQESAQNDKTVEEGITVMKKLEEKMSRYQKQSQEYTKFTEIKKRLEQITKAFLLEIESECLCEGLVVEYDPEGSHHIQMLLFSDILVMCGFHDNNQKKIQSSNTDSRIEMKMENVMELSTLQVVNLTTSGNKATGQHKLKFIWNEGETTIYVTEKEQEQWVNAIDNAKKVLSS